MEIDVTCGAYIDPRKARVAVAEWCRTWLEGYDTHRPSVVRQAQVHIRRIVMEFGSPWAVERAMRTARKKVPGLPAGLSHADENSALRFDYQLSQCVNFWTGSRYAGLKSSR